MAQKGLARGACFPGEVGNYDTVHGRILAIWTKINGRQ
jgi:hypothetical protein